MLHLSKPWVWVQPLQVAAMSLLMHTVFSAAQAEAAAPATLAAGVSALCARFEPQDVVAALQHLVAEGVLADPQSGRPFGLTSAWRVRMQVRPELVADMPRQPQWLGQLLPACIMPHKLSARLPAQRLRS